MPMLTVHADCPTPTISRSGSFTTIRFDHGFAVQLDPAEWTALVEAITATTALNTVVDRDRVITRNENDIRSAATVREEL